MVSIQDHRVEVDAINLVLRVVEGVQHPACDVDACDSEEEPLLLDLAGFKHLNCLLLCLGICAELD